jgi:hypothetical protein
VVLLHANVIDGVGDAPVRDATVVVVDGGSRASGARRRRSRPAPR